ncbi:trypco2 family protein [Streptomyces echinatus]|uniref:trypco2 family protein n=1 Tax=Streptomyces echinatus TaxID=67293 RepID=UPI0037BA37DB
MTDRTDQVLRYLGALREQADRDPGGAGSRLADALAAAVDAFHEAGDDSQALLLAQELVARQRSSGNWPDLAQALYVLGSSLDRVGAPDEAGAVLEECVSMTDRLRSGGFDTLGCAARERLSAVRANQGRMAEALELLASAVDGYRVMAEADPALYGAHLARSLHNQAMVQYATHQVSEAVAALDETIDVYHSLLNGGDRSVAAGLGRSLAARKEISTEAGLPYDEATSDALLQRVAALATPAGATFDPAPASHSSTDGLREAITPEEPGDRQTMAIQPLIPLPQVIQAVRLQLEEVTQNSGGYLKFEMGPIDLDLSVSLSVDSRAEGGVRVLVVTDSAGVAQNSSLHRMKLTLTPRSMEGPVRIGGDWEV